MGGARGQAWSMDLIIGVLIFLFAAGVIYSLLANKEQDNPDRLRIESEVVAAKLTSSGPTQVAQDNQLDMPTLYALAASSDANYDELKTELGVDSDFCIYLQDEQGNLVYIQSADGATKYPGIGPGNGDVTLTTWDIPCGEPCSAGECQ